MIKPEELIKGTVIEQYSQQVQDLVVRLMKMYAQEQVEKMQAERIGEDAHKSLYPTSNDGNGKHW